MELAPFLVDRFDDPPRCLRDVCVFEHYVLGLRVLLPACTGFHVHRTKFPLLERIMNAHHKSKLLLIISDRRDGQTGVSAFQLRFTGITRVWPG